MTGRRSVVALAAAGTLVAGAMAAGPATAAGNNGNPNNSKKFTALVTADGVMRHLEALQSISIADDNKENGYRASGTDGYEAAANYVEEQLDEAGYETERQYFDFIYEQTLAASLKVGAQDIDTIVMSYSPDTPVGGITAELVAPTNAIGCTAEDWADVDAAGKIALVSRGSCSFAQKSLAAAAEGAVAAIIYNTADEPLNGTLGALNDGHVPTSGILRSDGLALLEAMAAGPVTATLDLRQISEERQTFNILAETKTGRDDNVVMLGAHLDSATEGPGINDNGSGSATILETAIQLARVNKLNNKVRFAWWGAEERGLLGSTYYVDDLVKNNPAELDNIATYVNVDMVASPNYIIGVFDANESTYEAPVPVPPGSAQTEAVFTDYFDSIGQPWVDTEFSGRSDYQPFVSNGIPASGLFTGADGKKTPEQVEMFGGTAGMSYDPNYHTPADDISNVNKEALGIMSKAIAHATITLAYDTSAINGKRSAGKSGVVKPDLPQMEAAA